MNPLLFQAICWHGCDIEDSQIIPNCDDDNEDGTNVSYVIDIFGKSQTGESVCVHVPFKPYFFVELPAGWTAMHAQNKVFNVLRNKMKYKKLDSHVNGFKVVARKKFYGFTNNREFNFCCIFFKSMAAYNYAASILKKDFSLYESNVDPILRLMHVRDLESSGWVEVAAYQPQIARYTHCDIEIVANQKDLSKREMNMFAPLVIASFDIECISHDGAFPNPKDQQSPIIQIATCFQRYGEAEPYERHIVCLGDTAPIEGVELRCVDSEPQLLREWAAAMKRNKADIMVGYNIWGFDMEYIFERAMVFGGSNNPLVRRFMYELSRYSQQPVSLQTMTLSSSAYGNNEWKTVRTWGILQIDLMQIIRKEYKLDSYKLDSVAEHFVGDKKVDLPIPLMFQLYKGDAEDKRKIAEYCVKDTELPLKILSKLAIVPNMVEMAKATHVPLDFLIPRGQQIKVFSQILKKTREKGYLCPTRPLLGKDDKYEGATVLDAVTGAHWNVITCLDFASLYPSIMRAHNMCHSTIVIDERFDNLPGIEYYDVDGVRFAQNSEGILPELLRDLAAFRKKAKKDMAIAKANNDKFTEMLCNGKQLAYKVSMNSMYGFCGAATGFLPCIKIASSVTNVGRNMIAKTKGLIESNYPGSRVVYGDTDSVMIDFGTDNLGQCFKWGEEAAAMVTSTFKSPIELTFEKCYRPYLLFAKKRYAGLYYTNPDKPDKLDCKGIQLVRRDNCRLVKTTLERLLELIMYSRDIDGAVSYVKQVAADLLAGKVDIQDLVLSKTLKASAATLLNQTRFTCAKCKGKTAPLVDKDVLACQSCGARERLAYKNSMQPHIVVACKLEERNPGSGPAAGERVPFLYSDPLNPEVKNAQASLAAEDVLHIRENNVPIDYMYYLEHQLKKPVVDLMGIILPDCENTLFTGIGEDEYTRKRTSILRSKLNAIRRQAEITSFFKPKA